MLAENRTKLEVVKPAAGGLMRSHALSVEERLRHHLPKAPPSERADLAVVRAMEYALQGPGKRLRPILTLGVGELCGAPTEPTLDLACAIEMVHASSLILDDMPCMDDGSLRRGRSTVHRAFGEEMALLAAFGLLNRAYAILGAAARQLDLQPRCGLDLLDVLVRSVGVGGLIGGQARDLAATEVDPKDLESIERAKTAVLFVAAARLGGMAGRVDDESLDTLAEFAESLGLAFQVADDLLDAFSSTSDLGKDVGQDAGKLSFVGLVGPLGARRRAVELLDHADARLADVRQSLSRQSISMGAGSAGHNPGAVLDEVVRLVRARIPPR